MPRWTEEEEASLAKLMSKDEKMTWPEVAKALKTGRSAQAVMQHWKSVGGGQPSKKPSTG